MLNNQTDAEKQAAWALYEAEKKMEERESMTIYKYFKSRRKKEQKLLQNH